MASSLAGNVVDCYQGTHRSHPPQGGEPDDLRRVLLGFVLRKAGRFHLAIESTAQFLPVPTAGKSMV
jgi:hypothetical protein